MLVIFTIAGPGEACKMISGTLGREGRAECCSYSGVPMWQPTSVSVKDRAVLAPMASLELCTDRMTGFMGPG
jgi:hypothetical protein